MRILHCIPNMLSGGAQRQLSYLAAEQVRRNEETHVVLMHEGAMLPQLKASGATLHWLNGFGHHDPRLLWQLMKLMRAIRFDVVHTWLMQMDILGGLVARSMNVPWVLREPNSGLAYPNSVKFRLRAAIGSGASAVVANSREGVKYWEGRLKHDRLYVIKNGVPCEEIARGRPIAGDSLALADDRKVVVYAGRLNPQKNIENLVLGMALAGRKLPLTGFLCGDGSHQKQAEDFVRSQGLAAQIILTGYTPDVWPMMKRADVFVSVSRFEGQPNSVLEAAACGCPIVLSDIPTHREVLDDESALFVDGERPEDIARGILASLSDPILAARRAAAARRRVEPWSVTAMAQQYENVYRNVARSGAGVQRAA